jgi:Flp pilus assembly protein TadG
MAAVEAALIVPVLLLIVMGTLEYGWMFWKAADVNNAARQGARVAALGGATATDVTDKVLTALTAAGLQGSGYILTITPDDPSTLSSGEDVTVQISIPYANIAVVNSALIPTPTNLVATVVMPREGP